MASLAALAEAGGGGGCRAQPWTSVNTVIFSPGRTVGMQEHDPQTQSPSAPPRRGLCRAAHLARRSGGSEVETLSSGQDAGRTFGREPHNSMLSPRAPGTSLAPPREAWSQHTGRSRPARAPWHEPLSREIPCQGVPAGWCAQWSSRHRRVSFCARDCGCPGWEAGSSRQAADPLRDDLRGRARPKS